MSNAEGTVWMVYNGETYNYYEEREILVKKGYSFHSASDTEVVLSMYEAYGDDFLVRMRGIFALAIYDKRRGPGREKLLLARDHLGIKPLVYGYAGNRLVFASELKGLLASGLGDREIDPVSLQVLLNLGSISQPHTMLKGVRMLPPGHRLILEHSKERMERYWSLGIDRRDGLRRQPYSTLVEELERVLKESLRLQLASDVPVGAFLSGGVDSSVLVGMMAQATGHRVKTYSVGFEAEGAAMDESRDARRTADFLGTDHTHVLVKGTDVRDGIRSIAWSLDQPSVDGVNSHFVSLAARKGVTVALSGTGGDEIFGGYPWFIQMARYQEIEKKPAWALLRSLLSSKVGQRSLGLLRNVPGSPLFERLRNQAGFLSRYASNFEIFGGRTATRLLSPEFRKLANRHCSDQGLFQPIDELSAGTVIERVTGLCLRGYTSNQLLRDIDAVSMAHSLEVRVPYLDPWVVDTALSLPDSAKLGDLKEPAPVGPRTYRETGAKRILIDLGRKYLPGDFDDQPKRGFTMPFGSWLKGPLREALLETLSENTVRRRGWLDVREVTATRRGFFEGRLGWQRPWVLMMLELWGQEVLERGCKRAE
jgi:asparagine synthase (glutamine-hydrolysing)